MRLPVVILIAVYVLAIAVDLCILADFRWRPGKSRRRLLPFRRFRFSAPWLYIFFSIACLALFTVAVSLPRRDDASLQPVWWMLYIFLTLFAGKIGYLIGSAVGRVPQIWRSRRRDTRMWLGLPLCFLCVFTLVWGALIGRRHIEIKEVSVSSPDLPAAFDGYRIVQFSDAHVDTWGEDTTFVARMVERINALRPDMIVFTGDIVSRRTSEILPFIQVLSRLNAPDGVYSVLGNHDYGDYYDWPSETMHRDNIQWMKRIQTSGLGWKLLDNTSDVIRHGTDSIRIIGVENWGEPPFRQYGDLAKARAGASPEEFVILLSHNPMHWHEVTSRDEEIDLTLSGHTHAMQCQFSLGNLRWSPSQWRYPEWSGLYSARTQGGRLSQLYVNIGSGEVAMPARIGTAFPEITLITLRRGGSPAAP